MKALYAADARSLGVNLITAVIAVKLLRNEPGQRWDDGAAAAVGLLALGVIYWGVKNG